MGAAHLIYKTWQNIKGVLGVFFYVAARSGFEFPHAKRALGAIIILPIPALRLVCEAHIQFIVDAQGPGSDFMTLAKRGTINNIRKPSGGKSIGTATDPVEMYYNKSGLSS